MAMSTFGPFIVMCQLVAFCIAELTAAPLSGAGAVLAVELYDDSEVPVLLLHPNRDANIKIRTRPRADCVSLRCICDLLF